MLKLIFSKYDAYKVFQVKYMRAMLLDFLPEVKKLCYKTMALFVGLFPHWKDHGLIHRVV